jgi:hypothetical protein
MAVRLDDNPVNMRYSTEASRHCSPIYTAPSSFFTRAEDMGVGQSAPSSWRPTLTARAEQRRDDALYNKQTRAIHKHHYGSVPGQAAARSQNVER